MNGRSRLSAAAGTGVLALLAGCGGGGGTPAQQVANWASSTGFSASLRTIRGDLVDVARLTAAAGKPLHTACDALVTDTLSANEQLPTPDTTLTSLLSKAYDSAAGAGRDCYAGAANGAAGPLVQRSVSERQAAETQLVAAEARYDALVSSLPGNG
ncbi:MAG TPA: hypothetical protein VE991_00400 [Acidimicrobiales bacterium]|nr:hypothetical protein [Acidimicrobiales bacterium]